MAPAGSDIENEQGRLTVENDADNSALGNGSSGVCTNERPRSGLGFDIAGMVASLLALS